VSVLSDCCTVIVGWKVLGLKLCIRRPYRALSRHGFVLALFWFGETARFLKVWHMCNFCSQTENQNAMRQIFGDALGGWQLTMVAEGGHEDAA
jgi:hypothetical protein